MKNLIGSASTILWVTSGGILNGSRPDFAVASAIGRSAMAEHPSLKFVNFDVQDGLTQVEESACNILSILDQLESSSCPDFEFIQNSGLLHISRFNPDVPTNRKFQSKYAQELSMTKFQDTVPSQLAFQNSRELSTAYLRPTQASQRHIQGDMVEIEVNSVIMDPRSQACIMEYEHTQNRKAILQSTGIVTRIGECVSSLSIGDAVTTVGPAQITTSAHAPEWSCIKLASVGLESNPPSIRDSICATYALTSCCRVHAGKRVLIASGALTLGMSAFGVARALEADVYMMVQTQQEQELAAENLGILRQHVFLETSATLTTEMMTETEQEGFDVVFATSDGLHDLAVDRFTSRLGHVVTFETGDSKPDPILLNSLTNKRISFSSFDLQDLFDIENKKCERLCKK